MINNYVIGIQAFVKLDTVTKLINSLFQCIGIDKYKIIFFIDNIDNSLYKNRSDWIEKNQKVYKYLQEISQKHNIELYQPTTNIGCYKGCQQLIDMCMNYSDYVIFLEDDIVLGKDALVYYENIYSQYIADNNHPCIDAVCSSTWRQYTTTDRINTDNTPYVTHLEVINWIHSYEFAITKPAWDKYRDIRGSARGDILLGCEFQKYHKYSILPKIGRSCRIGYNHQDGYSTYYKQLSQLPPNVNETPESNYLSNYIVSKYNLLNNPCITKKD